jgi:hypothetical protein
MEATKNLKQQVLSKVAYNGSVLPKAGYSVFRQPIPKLIYFLLPKITFVV